MGNYLFVCLRKGLTLDPCWPVTHYRAKLASNSVNPCVSVSQCWIMGINYHTWLNYFRLCSTGFSTDRWVPFPFLGAGVFSQLALIDRMGQRQHYQNPMSTSFCSLGAQLPHHEKTQFVEEGGHGGENSEAHAKASTSCLSSE